MQCETPPARRARAHVRFGLRAIAGAALAISSLPRCDRFAAGTFSCSPRFLHVPANCSRAHRVCRSDHERRICQPHRAQPDTTSHRTRRRPVPLSGSPSSDGLRSTTGPAQAIQLTLRHASDADGARRPRVRRAGLLQIDAFQKLTPASRFGREYSPTSLGRHTRDARSFGEIRWTMRNADVK